MDYRQQRLHDYNIMDSLKAPVLVLMGISDKRYKSNDQLYGLFVDGRMMWYIWNTLTEITMISIKGD